MGIQYIVTGAAGLIGSAVIAELNRRGVESILAVDHLGDTTDKWRNLAPLKFADYMERDEFRETLLAGELNGCGVEKVIHMGACSSTTERDASYLADNNFACTKEVAAFAIANEARFLYASSCATYGAGENGYVDDETAIAKLRPLNIYGYSKQMFDLWALRNRLFGAITGCKFSNVYGPNERHKGEMRSVVLRAYEQITATGKMKLFKSYRKDYADGEQMRDFLYVKDAAEMVLFLLDHPQGFGLYNVGSGRAETWNALAHAAFKALGKKPKIEYIAMPETLRSRYQYYTKTEMAKLRALGWKKRPTSLERAIADYYQNYLVPGKFLGD